MRALDGYSFENLRESPNTATEEEVAAMWRSVGAVTRGDTLRERLAQALFVARDPDGNAVGVCTVVQRKVPRLLDNAFHYYRSFVAAPARQAGVATELLLRTRNYLESVQDRYPRCKGVFMEIENDYIKRVKNEGVWEVTRFVFAGVSEEGAHLRVYYFPGATIS